MSRNLADFVGFFLPGESVNPAHDPGEQGKCLVCCKSLALTGAVMRIGGLIARDGKTYFFRAHKACWARLGDQERTEYEKSLTEHEVVITPPPAVPT